MRQAHLPLRHRRRSRPRSELVADAPRRRQDRHARHRAGGRSRSARAAGRVPPPAAAGPGADRDQRPVLGDTLDGWTAGTRGGREKGGFAETVAAEVGGEVERLIGAGAADGIDFEAVGTAARRLALEVVGKAVAARLNADRSDGKGARRPCACGARARYAGRRPKTFTTALGGMELARAWYHCDGCGAGFAPRDRELGMEGTSLSPAALRMAGAAAARVSFAETSVLLRELAGLDIDAKSAERHAEALGRAVADDELAVVEREPSDARTLYLGLDGTGVPVRKEETDGRKGKQADGSARTREAKIVAVWSAEARDRDGRPVRDPGSATYSAAIETIASRDTDPDPAPFARRALREAARRGFHDAPRRVVLGDGAAWIWNWADEHAPGAIQIVDAWHAREHLFEAASTTSSTPCGPMPTPATKPASASPTSTATATACATRSSATWGCASPPASSRAPAKTSSAAASSAAACTGPSTAPTPSSHCDAPSSATASTTSGSAAHAGNRPHPTILTCTPAPNP